MENLSIDTFMIKNIKSDFSNIKNLFRELKKTKESLPILYNETLELLLKSDDIDAEFIKKEITQNLRFFQTPK